MSTEVKLLGLNSKVFHSPGTHTLQPDHPPSSRHFIFRAEDPPLPPAWCILMLGLWAHDARCGQMLAGPSTSSLNTAALSQPHFPSRVILCCLGIEHQPGNGIQPQR